MRALLIAAAWSMLGIAGPVSAQATDHAHHGHDMAVDTPPADPHAGHPMTEMLAPAADPGCPPEHAAMGHCTPSKAEAPAAPNDRSGTALPAGNASAPPAPVANYADRIWGREAMASSRADLAKHHGGGTFSQVMVDLAEAQFGKGGDGYRWDGEAWFGGDINRMIVTTEGEGAFRGDLEHGEVQALYARAIGPYFNLQAGVRQDIGTGPSRTHAAIGIEGLAPYWFELEAMLYLSDKGDVSASIEGYYDQRITQRLILQPRIELNIAAQDVPGQRIGAGITDGEIGLRLRYEVVREFAPYVGAVWQREYGRTARLRRNAGEQKDGIAAVMGIRAWF